MRTTLRKMTILVAAITFIALCAITLPVFAADKYPNYEASEAVIAQAKKEGQVVIYDWAEWWPEELFTGFEKNTALKLSGTTMTAQMQ